ncbi:MAG: hypothetical protein ACLUB2_00650 [Butyricicoccus pullicaecorum]
MTLSDGGEILHGGCRRGHRMVPGVLPDETAFQEESTVVAGIRSTPTPPSGAV